MSDTDFEFLRRLRIGFNIATSVLETAPCLTFGASHPINDLYADKPKADGYPNPWHIGTMGSRTYPKPHELIQGELELLVFMFGLVVQLKPKVIFESGTNVGLTTRALAAGCFANGFGTVVSCETDPEMVAYAKTVVGDLPAQILNIPALDCDVLGIADLVFIDSSYESRSKEHKLVKSGAVYVYHDSYAEPWVRPEMDYEQFKVHLDTPRGFSIVRKA